MCTLLELKLSRIKEQYGCEPPLGFVRTTKAYTIPANSHIGIHGLTKVNMVVGV